MKLSYAALHCLSNFTFLRGASHAKKLVERAASLGYRAIAITDECSVSGAVRAHLAAMERKLKLLVGAEFAVHDAPAIDRVILLARNRNGYGDLCELITLARQRASKGQYRLYLNDLHGVSKDCLAIIVPQPLHADFESCIATVAAWFASTCWLGAALMYGPDDEGLLDWLETFSERHGVPLVACDSVLYAEREDRQLQDVLTAIRFKCPVAELGANLSVHAEHYLKPIPALQRRYPESLLTATLVVESLCSFKLSELVYEYPDEVVLPGEVPDRYLRKLTYAGAMNRYKRGLPGRVRQVLEKELALIIELQYEAFFLTIYDVVKFARSKNILCQGRGSAANSAVCYCLGITEVNPARAEVLFERFLSKERKEPPDIDVDFEHERREEVMQYIFGKYGRDRTALAAAVSTYRPKGAIRDVGKAMGLTLSQVDALSKSIVWWDGHQIAPQRLREAGFDPDNPHMQKVLELTRQLIGFPRHLSQHSGGFVIAKDKLTRLVPVENAAMPERTVIQWDKDDLERLGLLKVDVLALGMLTAIRKTLEIVGAWRGKVLTMQQIPSGNEETYRMIQRADTIGVFQIESRAQMSMLPRLKPKNYYDLVIEVAIVRPGPIEGGMVHPYLKRRNGEEPKTYPSEAVKGVLKRTLGVPIFQEQVMRIAMVAAGYSADEADELRRDMAAWKKKGGMEKHEQKLIGGMLVRGYERDFAERIFRQVLGFGEYGFPESHAASFALLVYVSSWLKCHHPAAFTCGLLNSQPLGFYSPAQLVQDVQRHGVRVLPVDVMVSQPDCVLEGDRANPAIRLGLCMIGPFNKEAAMRLTLARKEAPFCDVADLKRRARLDAAEISALASADALATLIGNRREALWEVLGVENDAALYHAPLDNEPATLLPPTEVEDIFADYRHVGVTLRRHPVALLRPTLSAMRISTAEQVKNARPRQLIRAAGLVTCRQHPETAKGTTFVTLEDETGYVNVVVWPRVAERQRRELVFSRLMSVAGHVERQGEVVHLIAGRLFDQTELLGELHFSGREFH